MHWGVLRTMGSKRDFRIYPDRAMCVVGPSQSGKTTFVLNLLDEYLEIFHDPRPSRILWFYGVHQSALNQLLKSKQQYLGIPIEIKEGIPSVTDIRKGDLIVMDDLLSESQSSKAVSQMFTRHAHHHRCFIIFLSQNLFAGGKEYRTQSLNTHYLVLFKNPRDKSQINFLARQVEPRSRAFIDMYEEATKRPHGYLFIDLTQECPDEYRYRTNILPADPQPMLLFVIRNH